MSWKRFCSKQTGCLWIQDRFSEYLDGMLSEEERLRVHEHVAVCEKCSKELGRLSDTLSLLADFREQALPEAIQNFRLPRYTFIEIFPTIHEERPIATAGFWTPCLTALLVFFMVISTWIMIERYVDKQVNWNYIEVYGDLR
jgi:predicted anti-sigma-YlaC factor YlaD